MFCLTATCHEADDRFYPSRVNRDCCDYRDLFYGPEHRNQHLPNCIKGYDKQVATC